MVGGLLDEVRPALLVMEDDTGQHPAVTRTLRAYQTAAALAATRRGIPVSVDLCASRVRAVMLGDGGTPKALAINLGRWVYDLTGTDNEVGAGLLLLAAETLIARGEPLKAPRKAKKRKTLAGPGAPHAMAASACLPSTERPAWAAAPGDGVLLSTTEAGMTGLVSGWLASHHAPALVADDYQLVASPDHVLVVPVRAGFVCPGQAMVSLPREVAVGLFDAMLARARERA